MTHLSISLLGAFSVTLDGREARGFESDKARALLAYLALEGVRPQRREMLAALLWPEQPESRARASLNQALYNLRSLLGDRSAEIPYLLSTPQTLQLNPSSDFQVDVRQFEELLSTCEQHLHPRLESCEACASRLAQAVSLYQGEFLQGFSPGGLLEFEEWALVIRERSCQNAIRALSGLAGYHEARGEFEQALEDAGRIVQLNPLWETGQRGLIRALALSGQREAALEGYKKYRDRLWDELGVEPEKETQKLYERLRRESPHEPAIDNLPAHLTPFVGRRAELVELGALLSDPGCRLVTVLGEGGSGKTRLALRVAEGLRYHFPDGVYLVSLSALGSVEGLVPAMAEALELVFREAGDPQAQLVDYLRGKRILLVLDSFETVLGGAGWLSDLLRTAPGVKALVTSRARLNVRAEQLFLLGGMRYPSQDTIQGSGLDPGQYSAMQLFQAGARRTQPHLEWDSEGWQEVARICQLVRGMPLGLLLASAWLGAYNLAEIAAEIERSLDFLSADWGDIPQRQRSLRATLDYSWQLLNDDERKLLSQLSVFQGGFTRQAAVAVYAANPLILQTLVDKSMLEIRSAGRYGMHDLLRQYAAEKLAEEPLLEKSARAAHATYYLGALADWNAGLKSDRQLDVLMQMDIETGNLGAAWTWAVDHQVVDLLAGGLEGLCLYASLRARYKEGQIACQYLLDRLGTPGKQAEVISLVVRSNGWKAHFLRLLGQHEHAAALLTENLAVLGELEYSEQKMLAERAFLLMELGSATMPSNRQAAKLNFEASLRLYTKTGDLWWQAKALAGLGLVAHHAGTFDEAVNYCRRSLALYEQTGDPKATASILIDLGQNSLRMGLLEQGEAYIQRGVEIYEKIGDRASQADSLLQLSRMCFWSGKLIRGKSLGSQARPIFLELGLLENYTFTLVGESLFLILLGEIDAARMRAREGGDVARANGFLRFHAISYWVLGMADLAEGKIHPAHDQLELSVELYRTIKQNDELAWALATLAYADYGLGHTAEFLDHICETLQIALKVRGLFPLMLAVPAVALYLTQRSRARDGQASRDDLERAVELYALARRYPTAVNAPWFEATAGKTIAAAAASLPQEAVNAAIKRGQEGELFTTAQDLLNELCQGRMLN